jgi:hypothetical protein
MNKCGDAQNSSPDSGDRLPSQVRELVEIQPMQTIIRRMTAWSRHELDIFHEGFYGVPLPLSPLFPTVNMSIGGIFGAVGTGFRWWLQRAFSQSVKLV